MNIKLRKQIITCSKCKSTNIVNPVNDDKVELLCLDCGHTKEKKRLSLTGEPCKWVAEDLNTPRVEEF